MGMFTKPTLIKYECRTEDYVIYFSDQYDVAKYLRIPVQKLNYYINRKKGVCSFEERVDEGGVKYFIDNVLERIWELPEGTVVNKEYDITDKKHRNNNPYFQLDVEARRELYEIFIGKDDLDE